MDKGQPQQTFLDLVEVAKVRKYVKTSIRAYTPIVAHWAEPRP